MPIWGIDTDVVVICCRELGDFTQFLWWDTDMWTTSLQPKLLFKCWNTCKSKLHNLFVRVCKLRFLSWSTPISYIPAVSWPLLSSIMLSLRINRVCINFIFKKTRLFLWSSEAASSVCLSRRKKQTSEIELNVTTSMFNKQRKASPVSYCLSGRAVIMKRRRIIHLEPFFEEMWSCCMVACVWK